MHKETHRIHSNVEQLLNYSIIVIDSKATVSSTRTLRLRIPSVINVIICLLKIQSICCFGVEKVVTYGSQCGSNCNMSALCPNEDIIVMPICDKTKFFLSGMGNAYIHEWTDIYHVVLEFITKVYENCM